MLEPSIKLMKQKADSRYTLAILAAKKPEISLMENLY